jgi:DNA invertase Pin-like site-specific DNA recombinase
VRARPELAGSEGPGPCCSSQRPARSVRLVAELMEAGVDFVAVDTPDANRLTVHIIVALAKHEARLISVRTKDALGAAKRRGVRLGTPAI